MRAPAQTTVEFSEQKRDRLFLQALAVVPEDKVPVEFRSKIPPFETGKCATMLLAEVRLNFHRFTPKQQTILNEALARPDHLPNFMISSDGRFKIHYTTDGFDAVSPTDLNSNQIPDFVEEMASAFENSYQVEIDDLGYQTPPDDAGRDGAEYDVYIINLKPQQIYGETRLEDSVPGTPQNDLRGYFVVDNNYDPERYFSGGVEGAQVTAAHEFYHLVQFGYRDLLYMDEAFYYEFSSIWMEDVVYDDINDYYQYFLGNNSFFRRRDVPFNSFVRSNFGEALWNFFLVKKFDKVDLIRRTWEIMQSNVSAIEAINQSLFENGSNFRTEFGDFAVWNYFTGRRADPVNFYEESAEYPEVKLDGDFSLSADTTVVDSSLSLTHNYYKFTNFTSGDYSIRGDSNEPENWSARAIIKTPNGDYTLHSFNLVDRKNLGFIPRFSEIVIIPVNTRILKQEDLPMMNFIYSTFRFTLTKKAFEPETEQKITAIYPNPFRIGSADQERINFRFNQLNTEDIEVRIINASGKIVKTVSLDDGTGLLSLSSFSWDGADSDNQPVASGIYIFQLKQDQRMTLAKFAVIRE
ncbi:MAG: MXAN_6640 family putative metalloprotease [bacterium]